MKKSNDEWARNHLDEVATPNTASEKRFDEHVARVLSTSASCPDALWQTLHADMTNRVRPSQRFLQRIANRRVLTTLLAASVLVVFSSSMTAFLIGLREEASTFQEYETQQELEVTPALASNTTPEYVEEDTAPPPQHTQKSNRIDRKLAALQAALAQSKKERDLAVTERDEAKKRLKELEKSLVFAQTETESLRSDLALARRETKNDTDGLRQTAGRLNINFDTNVVDSSGSVSRQETALYMPSSLSDASEPADKNINENSPLVFDKSN